MSGLVEELLERHGVTVHFDDVMVGQKAFAWSIGVMLDAYPQQTSAMKVDVAD